MNKVNEEKVIGKYNKLVGRQQYLIDEMSNVGREKDYKVQKIEREYNFKIDNITRELKAVALQIDTIKQYVQAIGDDANPAVVQIKATKKERN